MARDAKRRRRSFGRRGIVGIESAIVMIAFVIVAAALAFVVLNMGFFTTQQSRAAIQRGLGEASSALELDGTVVAHVNTTANKIDYWFSTLKLSAGQHQVDLTPVKTVISYWSPQRGISLANTYLVAVTTPVYDPATIVGITKALLADRGDSANVTISGDKGDIIPLTITYYSGPYIEDVEFDKTTDITNKTVINATLTHIPIENGTVEIFMTINVSATVSGKEKWNTTDVKIIDDGGGKLKNETSVNLVLKIDSNQYAFDVKFNGSIDYTTGEIHLNITLHNTTNVNNLEVSEIENATAVYDCAEGDNYYWAISYGSATDYIDSSDWSIVILPDPSTISRFELLARYSMRIGLPDSIESANAMAPGELLEKYAGNVVSVIAWITKTNDDTVLDPGEKVLLVMYYCNSGYWPQGYDTIKAEVKVPIGAPLTIERTVPPSLTQEIVDLG